VITVFADGASRGNPGPASYGAAILRDGELIAELFDVLGDRTNNFAEYQAVIAALGWLQENQVREPITINMDSKLVVEQLSGRWQIKHPDLRPLAKQALELASGLDVRFNWVPREQNALADALANRALDQGAPITPAKIQPRSIRAPRQSTEPTTVFVLRHGHTASTESNLISGSNDNPPLSELGLAEAKLAAEAITRLSARFDLSTPELVVHSDQLRAAQTAELVAKQFDVPAYPDVRLREISFGEWERYEMSALEASSAEEIQRWRGSVAARPPGGESVLDLESRVLSSLKEAIENIPGASIALVAHMMPLRAIAKFALGASQSAHWGVQFAPASVSVFRFYGFEFAEVFCLNSCEHLPTE
jgi:ribonuclease H / adenosylcobalamin/alpha-ribazole phosphatase